MAEIQDQFNYFLAHQGDLVERCNGRYVVIVRQEVVRDFASQMEAYEYATANHEPGTFLIQRVTPGTDDYTQTFHSRIAS